MSSKPEFDSSGSAADRARLLEALLRTLPPLINPVQLSLAEIRKAFEPVITNCPPILSLKQAAEVAHLAPSTLKRKVNDGGVQGKREAWQAPDALAGQVRPGANALGEACWPPAR
ncbi:MAG: hypothetical protein IPM13_09570 [Phycisphaerales bacterium]|nr:hypothetical protein [Phycisphaerales bacterium]